MRIFLSVFLFLAFAFAHFSPSTNAQQKCLSPVALPAATELNIFSEEQEVYLGDAVAEQIQRNYSILEDAQLNAFLDRIGSRLTQHLPLTKMRFQFFLVDLPDVNAHALPGGRIYVSRKLVAMAESEDELAGVIAHELGHLVAREHSIDLTRRLREVLGITEVTDRRDIYEKYNLLIDNLNRKPGAFRERDREKGQLVADQIGFYALVNAGYDASAQSRLWDRATETKGRKGNFFTDLFGSTRPEERRLREMLRALSTLPAHCRQVRASGDEEFKRWQSSVISYARLGRRSESLHGVMSKLQLTPPLRSDIAHLRFSPDGKYVLAQDESGITVLTREPFATAFRIEAPDARPAGFTPDSENIVFYTNNLRVERWNVRERKMIEVKEVVVLNGCLQTKLSPDGKYLACLTPKFDLNVLSVATGQPVIQKKDAYAPDYLQYLGILWALSGRGDDRTDIGLGLVKMGFSPNGNLFAYGYYGPVRLRNIQRFSVAEAYDMTTLSKISLSDSFKPFIAGGFTFTANDRIVGVNYENQKKSGLLAFPSGQVISEFPLSPRTLIAPTRSNHLIVRPVKDYALGVMDTTTGTIFKVNQQPALDIYDDVFVAELRSGELGLYKMEKNVLLAAAQLENLSLGHLHVAELSSDMKWLALSGHSRGGVWNLDKGEGVLHLREFSGAYLSPDGFFYADFPKFDEAERNVAKFNLATNDIVQGPKIESPNTRQIGPYLTVIKPAKELKTGELMEYGMGSAFNKDVVLNVFDAPSMRLLWSKPFPKEAPRVWVAPTFNTTVLVWNVKDEAAKSAIKADSRLTQRLAAMKEKEGDYYLQVVDVRTGAELGQLLIETGKGSFRLSNVQAAGNWVVITDTENRVLTYSLKSGDLIGRAFGSYAAVSEKTGLLSVENERGKLTVYDLATMNKRDEFTFPGPLSMIRFSADGQRLFVLTTNQTVYVLDVSSFAASIEKS
ncbi:MAG TPA: M48 family metalloprotease [Pyrinomonadaceae bacterium]|nr:M48 family metalloprotease [Pyrinomonadaceae bacterium]